MLECFMLYQVAYACTLILNCRMQFVTTICFDLPFSSFSHSAQLKEKYGQKQLLQGDEKVNRRVKVTLCVCLSHGCAPATYAPLIKYLKCKAWHLAESCKKCHVFSSDSLGCGGKVDILSKIWPCNLNPQWMKRREITKMGKESKSLDCYPPSPPRTQFFSAPQLLHLVLRADHLGFWQLVPPSREETVLQRHPFVLWLSSQHSAEIRNCEETNTSDV